MSFSLLKNIHIISAVLFILILLFKSCLILLNKSENLKQLKKFILIPDIVIQCCFLFSGIIMVIQGSSLVETNPGWFHIKMSAVVIGVIIAIIAFKKNNKILVVISLLIFIGIYGYTEMAAAGLKKGRTELDLSDTKTLTGIDIYSQYCVSCHGENGKKGLSGAKDLSLSVLSEQEAIDIITNGKNNMMGYKSYLSQEQIKDVTSHIQSLR